MPGQDIGESLVGSYLRYIEGCPIVLYNSFLDAQPGEVDVVAFKPQPQPGGQREIFLCEVTTHTQGFNTKTTLRLAEKFERVREFAAATFADEQHRYQWGSPVVQPRAIAVMDELTDAWTGQGRLLEFIVNAEYTRRVDQLVQHARANTKPTSEPGYRMLQILTSLRVPAVSDGMHGAIGRHCAGGGASVWPGGATAGCRRAHRCPAPCAELRGILAGPVRGGP